MSFFLVVYSRSTGKVDVSTFKDDDEAIAFRALREREGAKSEDDEVVLLMGDSREALQLTHSRYFANASELVEKASNDLDKERHLAGAI